MQTFVSKKKENNAKKKKRKKEVRKLISTKKWHYSDRKTQFNKQIIDENVVNTIISCRIHYT